jgi:hypothetical protein
MFQVCGRGMLCCARQGRGMLCCARHGRGMLCCARHVMREASCQLTALYFLCGLCNLCEHSSFACRPSSIAPAAPSPTPRTTLRPAAFSPRWPPKSRRVAMRSSSAAERPVCRCHLVMALSCEPREEQRQRLLGHRMRLRRSSCWCGRALSHQQIVQYIGQD